MNELYAEAGVKRKENIKTIGIRVLMIFAVLLSLILSSIHFAMLIVAAVVVCAVVFTFPLVKTEYEYIFCDGQLDFDRIMGGQRRKTVLRIDMEQVEIVAPQGSHSLDAYNNRANLKVKDFSSLDPSKKRYIIIVRKGEEVLKILFEPSEKMIGCMKQKGPRKVVEY